MGESVGDADSTLGGRTISGVSEGGSRSGSGRGRRGAARTVHLEENDQSTVHSYLFTTRTGCRGLKSFTRPSASAFSISRQSPRTIAVRLKTISGSSTTMLMSG